MDDSPLGRELLTQLKASPLSECSAALRNLLNVRGAQYEYLRATASRMGNAELIVAVNLMSAVDHAILQLTMRFLDNG